MAIAIKAPPMLTPPKLKTVPNASLTSAVCSFADNISPVCRSISPVERIEKAVSVQTTMVSANTSKMPHIPCFTGSTTLEAE